MRLVLGASWHIGQFLVTKLFYMIPWFVLEILLAIIGASLLINKGVQEYRYRRALNSYRRSNRQRRETDSH